MSAEFAFARSPYLVGFQAGWFKFTICAQHLYYGESKPDDVQRLAEAKAVTKLLKQRMKSKDRWANNAILIGDFNIFTTKDKTFLALEEEDFYIPAGLKGKYTNAKLDKPFDQIAFLAPDVDQQISDALTGIFPFFVHVYRDSDQASYSPDKSQKEYEEWRTYKMSDHLPVWMELGVDFGTDYLTRKMSCS